MVSMGVEGGGGAEREVNSHRGRRAITEGFGVLSKKSTIHLGLFSVKTQPRALAVAPYYVFE